MELRKSKSGELVGIAFEKDEAEIISKSDLFNMLDEMAILPITDSLLDTRLWLEKMSNEKGYKRFAKREIKCVDLLLKVRALLEKDFPDCPFLQENKRFQSMIL